MTVRRTISFLSSRGPPRNLTGLPEDSISGPANLRNPSPPSAVQDDGGRNGGFTSVILSGAKYLARLRENIIGLPEDPGEFLHRLGRFRMTGDSSL